MNMRGRSIDIAGEKRSGKEKKRGGEGGRERESPVQEKKNEQVKEKNRKEVTRRRGAGHW